MTKRTFAKVYAAFGATFVVMALLDVIKRHDKLAWIMVAIGVAQIVVATFYWRRGNAP